MSEQRSVPCINWPCTKGAGHAGPCGTSSKEQLAEILSDAHAIHCAAEVGMPCDCRVPDAIAELLRRAEPPKAPLHQWKEEDWSFPVRFLEAVKKAAPPDMFAPSLEGIECALLGYERATGIRLDDSARIENMPAVTKSESLHDAK